MRYTLGWSTTAGAVDHFAYKDANETYIAGKGIRRRMLEEEPQRPRNMVPTLFETASEGYWETSEESLERPSGHVLAPFDHVNIKGTLPSHVTFGIMLDRCVLTCS